MKRNLLMIKNNALHKIIYSLLFFLFTSVTLPVIAAELMVADKLIKEKGINQQIPQITSGSLNACWDQANKRVEILDGQGVFATVELPDTESVTIGKDSITSVLPEMQLLQKDGSTIIFTLPVQLTNTPLMLNPLSVTRASLITWLPEPTPNWVAISKNVKRGEPTEEEKASGVGVIRLPEIRLVTPFNEKSAKNTDDLKAFGTAGIRPLDGHNGSYAFLAVVDPQTNAGIVSGWTTSKVGSGIVFSGKTKDADPQITPEIQYGSIKTAPMKLGADTTTETFIIGRYDDARTGLESYAEMVAKSNFGRFLTSQTKEKENPLRDSGVSVEGETEKVEKIFFSYFKLPPIPSGYCTWYSDKNGGASNPAALAELAEFSEKNLAPFGMDFIQIDDLWQDGITKNGPRKNFTRVKPDGAFKDGMNPVATDIKEHGFRAGLWFMPFAGSVTDPHFPKEWFVKSGRTDEVNENGHSKRAYGQTVNREGEPYESFWGGTSLDMTKPEVQEYLRDTTKRMADDWGFNYFKLDGLWVGMACDQLYVNNEYRPDDFGEAVFCDETVTPVQAYRRGLEIIRDTAPDATILGCNVSQNMRMMLPSVGLLDMMRIGPDNGANWSGLKEGPWHGSNRYFLNGRVWWNDPDPIYVRNSMPYKHARLIATWAAISGQLIAMSDWLPDLSEERLEIIRRTMPGHGLKTARPLDLFRSNIPQIWHLTHQAADSPRRDVVAIYNWDDEGKEPKKIEFNLTEIFPTDSSSDNESVQYVLYDFWNKTAVVSLGDFNSGPVEPGDCKVLAIRKITSQNNFPQVVSTSRHVTQGIVDIITEKWDADIKTISGASRVVGGDTYKMQIYIPAGFGEGKDAIAEVSSGTVTVTPIKIEGLEKENAGWLEVTIDSPKNDNIEWKIKF
ncbi:MAG: glycoside hydrolase family 36 protein [Thermoguttaceae bacterium]